jgi:hypothetical protein
VPYGTVGEHGSLSPSAPTEGADHMLARCSGRWRRGPRHLTDFRSP